MDKVNVTTDKLGIDLILKGLRLIRVYQEREKSWITPDDKDDAKTLTDRIEKGLRKAAKTKTFTENPNCDPNTNCDW